MISVRVVAPRNGEIITLIINVEAQADVWPGCPLLKRGIYYGTACCHLNTGLTYSDYVEQQGISKRIEKGFQKGLIETCKELGVSRNTTLSKLITKFSLTETAAEELLSKYW